MKAVFFVSLLVLAVVSSVPIPWRGCGDSPIVQIESIEASVWPIQRGQKESVSFHAIILQPITGGTWDFSLTYAGRPVAQEKGYLRDVVDLPIQPGRYSKSFNATVPKELGAGDASIHIDIKDDNGDSIVCVNVDLKIKKDATAPFPPLVWEEASSDVTVGVPIPYKNCGKPTDKLTITKADASVWPPKVGAPITVNANATLSQDITGGTYELKVKILGLQIIDDKGKIEDAAKKYNITLPIKAGPYGISKTTTVPAWVPKGDIDVFVQTFNSRGDEIECIEVVAKLS